jgi:hypothetical protein
MNEPVIYFTLEGATPDQAKRCTEIIHTMFLQGAFNVRNGNVTLNFDQEGILMGIKKELRWDRKKSTNIPLQELLEYDTIHSNNPNSSNERVVT